MKVSKKIVVAFMMLGIIGSLVACQQEKADTSFYVKSSIADGDGIARDVIDVTVESERINLEVSRNVQIVVGFGGRAVRSPSGEEQTWVTIEAQDCVIEEGQESYKKYYPDFHTNDVYRPDENVGIWGWLSPNLCPNYFETFEIVFPEGEYVGEIVFSLSNAEPNGHVQITTVSLYYAKTDNIIVFSEESEFSAEQKLAAVIASES